MFKRNKSRLALAQHQAGYCAISLSWRGDKPVVEHMVMQQGQIWSAEVLKQLSTDVSSGSSEVSALLAASEYQLIAQEMPNVPQKEVLESVRWQIRDQLPFSAEDACLDVIQIPPGLRDQGRSIYAVAAAGELIRQRTSLIEKHRFKLSVFDIPEMAQRNIASLYAQGSDGIAMLSSDGEEYLLTISMDAQLCMTRRIGAGAAARQGDWHAPGREVERSLSYFIRHFGQPVSRLMLAGIEHKGFHDALSAQLETAVEALRLADVADISSVPELAEALVMAQALPAIGAAMRRQS